MTGLSGQASGPSVVIVGGGLAGSEAAWQAARLGAAVTLYEMRPARSTEAHRTGYLAELVCSNSLKSESLDNANGLLKLELKMLGSLLADAAQRARVPAGSGLCVDRKAFAAEVTAAVESHPNVTVVREEIAEVPPSGVAVVAPGPLASTPLAASLEALVGSRSLFFYDAVSPIIEADSLDMSEAFVSSRYGKGDSAYVNLPLDRETYLAFLRDLEEASLLPRREFEEPKFFSACMPIEEVARLGEETLAHGCMKPVGLVDPRTGTMPYAVAQLRPENAERSLFGMVGFQTRMRHGDQERIFRKLPGMSRARFARLGSIHRNTYISAPTVVTAALEHRSRRGLFFAGQITGSEGYMAAVATGLVAGINAARTASGESALELPAETMIGGLTRYVSGAPAGDFKPMNPSFGLVPPLPVRVRDRRRRNLLLSRRAAEALEAWIGAAGAGLEAAVKVKHSGVVS
jgi:methylenetetrahydrofolate--tRNA-(uracil-5-)-methyltransferase